MSEKLLEIMGIVSFGVKYVPLSSLIIPIFDEKQRFLSIWSALSLFKCKIYPAC